tara:strand:+ start:2015 stop:2560 length:546 start_codon:yes stop_codon:yes gene_type:complete
MKFFNTNIDKVKIIEPKIWSDSRGYFLEAFQSNIFNENGITETFVQDNEVQSKQGVLRGLHYQLKKPQGKLVRVIMGSIIDVAVDIRIGSPTFSQYQLVKLTAENRKMFYIPPGFAHGYLVLSNNSIVIYKCTNTYDPDDEYGIKWDDNEIGINWKNKDPILSKRDETLPLLKNQKFLPKF